MKNYYLNQVYCETKQKGDFIEIDTISKFIWVMKRYIITAVDVKTRYNFAVAYKKHNSNSVKDFFQKLEIAFPYKIKTVQTNNGSEFHKFFQNYLKEKKDNALLELSQTAIQEWTY
ncbi:hypothetical protein K0B03_04470 [Patescibacteria group bacterium]|nr:hypothetical protein [Patescibacteria group bacterium]